MSVRFDNQREYAIHDWYGIGMLVGLKVDDKYDGDMTGWAKDQYYLGVIHGRATLNREINNAIAKFEATGEIEAPE